jgi:thiol-disulfide isomerase/thioredoxin
VLLCIYAAPVFAVATGEPAPPLALPALSGERFDLDAHRGEVIYLDFWASWCAPCRKSFPWMNTLQERNRERGLRVVGVNLDESPADAERFLARTPAGFTVLLDAKGESARAWKVKGMPTSFLIGRDGKLRAMHTGFREEHIETMERELADALAAPR